MWTHKLSQKKVTSCVPKEMQEQKQTQANPYQSIERKVKARKQDKKKTKQKQGGRDTQHDCTTFTTLPKCQRFTSDLSRWHPCAPVASSRSPRFYNRLHCMKHAKCIFHSPNDLSPSSSRNPAKETRTRQWVRHTCTQIRVSFAGTPGVIHDAEGSPKDGFVPQPSSSHNHQADPVT